MNYIKQNHLSLLIVLGLIISLFGSASPGVPSLGGNELTKVTNTYQFNNRVTLTASSTARTFKIGETGTQVTRVNVGTCYMRPYAATIAATSTALVDCQGTAAWDANGTSALAGVTAGDFVVVSAATTTESTLAGLHVIAASASTTPGFIQLRVSNLTGTTFTWSTSATASGTASFVVFD